MKGIIERHNLHSKNLQKLEQPSLELQVWRFLPGFSSRKWSSFFSPNCYQKMKIIIIIAAENMVHKFVILNGKNFLFVLGTQITADVKTLKKQLFLH